MPKWLESRTHAMAAPAVRALAMIRRMASALAGAPMPPCASTASVAGVSAMTSGRASGTVAPVVMPLT